MILTHRVVWGIACALLLTACGGGGDSGGSPPPPPASYTVGGTVTGLSGTGLVLQNSGGGNLSVAANGAFLFLSAMNSGVAYSVTVLTQPSSPSQTCTVTNGSGTVGSANVSNVAVSCSTNTYAVGGTVTELVATGLVLQNNAGNDLTVSASGAFTFTTNVASGAAYAVTVKTQPTTGPLQNCTVSNGTGTVGAAAVTNVSVSCAYRVARFLYSANTTSANISGYSINAATGALTALAGFPVPSDVGPVFMASNSVRSTLYVATNGSVVSPPRVGAYAINAATGALTQLASSPFDLSSPTPPNGPSPVTRPLIHSSGNFGYMSIIGAAPLYGATVDTTGNLTAIPGLPTVGTGQGFGAIDSTGTYFFIPHNNLNGGVGGAVAAYRIGAGGALTSLGSTATGGRPVTAVIHPAGTFVLSSNNDPPGSVAVMAISGNGTLSAVSGSPFTTGAGSAPTGIAFHPTKNFVYVTDSNTTASKVAAYAMDSATGVLTPVAGSPFATGGAFAQGGRVNPTGKFFYVANNNNNAAGSIAVFSIDQTTGALTAISGSPFATPAGPTILVMDPSGQYAYSVNTAANNITSYTVNTTTGALTLASTVAAGTAPRFPELFGLP